jgi:ubiquitin-conjugating enzyme E2 D
LPATPPADPFHLRATIDGPAGTQYAGGVFAVDIQFPDDYPFRPPRMVLTTPIVSCDWDAKGRSCLAEERDHWSPALTFIALLRLWQSVMAEPTTVDYATGRGEEFELFRSNRAEYDRRVREWVRLYAQPAPQPAAAVAEAVASAAAGAPVPAKK